MEVLMLRYTCALAIALIAGWGSAQADEITAAALPDGRLELFVVQDGKLLTSWAKNFDANASFTALVPFNPIPTGTIVSVAAGRLLDGRLQVWVMTSSGISTSHKLSSDPNAGWSPWADYK
jgi:hypothetical protein